MIHTKTPDWYQKTKRCIDASQSDNEEKKTRKEINKKERKTFSVLHSGTMWLNKRDTEFLKKEGSVFTFQSSRRANIEYSY